MSVLLRSVARALGGRGSKLNRNVRLEWWLALKLFGCDNLKGFHTPRALSGEKSFSLRIPSRTNKVPSTSHAKQQRRGKRNENPFRNEFVAPQTITVFLFIVLTHSGLCNSPQTIELPGELLLHNSSETKKVVAADDNSNSPCSTALSHKR